MNDSKVIDWLLEPDNPGVRYLTLRDLAGADESEIQEARIKAHQEGPIAQVLVEMNPEGYWEKPGAGYYPKYSGTVWSVILLAQLGASTKTDDRIASAYSYMLENTLTKTGQFTMNGKPSGTIDCLQGSLCGSLLDIGINNPQLDNAFEWMARTVTGEGLAPVEDRKSPLRYYAYKRGPNFVCGANNKLSCAWGATKVMLAFGKLTMEKRPPLINDAIKTGVDFLFSVDPATAEYPCGYASKPNGAWWKFGFPVFYTTDILQTTDALVRLGYGKDPRLANALQLIRDKQDDQGRWLMEYSYAGKTWGDLGLRKQPNKWVTLRALRVLKQAEQ
ncbi:nitrogen fixation protein NifH [Chloroflexota bacterium]